MGKGLLLDRIESRVQIDKEDGDIAYFTSLMLQLEYISKIVTAGVVSCIGEDLDRHRYSLEYQLVRSNSIGEWDKVLNQALTGPPAQFFRHDTIDITRDLTERVDSNDWRYDAVNKLVEAASVLDLDAQIGEKVALRQFFQIASSIRNRTRGHGATTSAECGLISPFINEGISLVVSNLNLFNTSWAHLYRSISGKYRVTALLGECQEFEYLKRVKNISLSNGVYIHIGEPILIPLVFADNSSGDISLPNGDFKSNEFEVLSYTTNKQKRENGSNWLTPVGRLPSSETEGESSLDAVGNAFSNLPNNTINYISRNELEKKLYNELLKNDRHPIVTLTGPGGIGKTSLAIQTIRNITNLQETPYELILWMSARDIDLLDTGPKPVSPKVVTIKELAKFAVELLNPSEKKEKKFNPIEYFQKCLQHGAAGTTLFVLDNFETVENPSEVFTWIDTYIRLPNKVLITTRYRDFLGDYPIEIGGMNDSEATHLIDSVSKRLGVDELLTSKYKEGLIKESDGHPYVIKILLGQISIKNKLIKLERVVASSDHLLKALFERTYDNLSPKAQRVFLLLCSWRAVIPVVAIEAVSLRPDNERFDVSKALDELKRFSLVEEIASEKEEEVFVGVPLAASIFGRKKLEISPYKVSIEGDRKLLLEFGAGKKDDAIHGILPRVENLFKSVSVKVNQNPAEYEKYLPILEYCASRAPKAYIDLAELTESIDEKQEHVKKTINYLRLFLQNYPISDNHKTAWFKIADLSHSINDVISEVHALSEVILLSTTRPNELGDLANRINKRIKELKGRKVEDAWSPEVRTLLEKAANRIDNFQNELSATDCSRLAWLYLNIGNDERARDIVDLGIERNPTNIHCQKLKSSLV